MGMEDWKVGPHVARYSVVGKEEIFRLSLVGVPHEFDALSVGTRQRQVAIIPLDDAGPRDAALIAAAPDMLAALEKVLRVIPQNLDTVDAFFSVKEAIEKARGRK